MGENVREFLKKYRAEFVFISLATIAFVHVFYSILPSQVNRFMAEHRVFYNWLLMLLSAAIFLVARISYPKIYKFKILLSGYVLVAFFITFMLITNSLPFGMSGWSVMGLKLDFFRQALEPPDHFAWRLLLTLLGVNLLAVIMVKATVNYQSGKNYALIAMTANFVLFLIILGLVAGSYRGSEEGRLATKFVSAFNRYFLPLNFLILTGTVALSVFNMEEEHNYGSIIVGVALMTFYCAAAAHTHFFAMKAMLPLMAVLIIAGMFVHWVNCLHHKAHYDPLLKIYNRQYMDAIIGGIADLSLGEHFSVLMCDIDHFKKVNDTYGHSAGDTVLHGVAQVVRDTALPEGIVCRYGGEEIIVFLRGRTDEEAKFKAEKIRKAVKRNSFKTKSKNIKVTMSIGCASTKQGIKNIRKIIKEADECVYKAKKRGRDRVVMA